MKPRRVRSVPTSRHLLLLAVVLAVAAFHSVSADGEARAAAVVAVEGSEPASGADAAAVHEPAKKQAAVPEFVPTAEWQEILPGQGIPKGLHVRLNLETGKREAKLVDKNDEVDSEAEDRMRSVVVDPSAEKEKTVTVSTNWEGDIVTDVDEDESSGLEINDVESAVDDDLADGDAVVDGDKTNWNHEKIYEVLQALPEPPKIDGMDIHDAHAKLSPAEFRLQMISLWKKRQSELKHAIDNIQDDSKYLAKLLEQFREAEDKGDLEGQLSVLEVIEWEVQDLDKTLVFNFIGGFGIMAEYLNATVLPVRAHAAWVVGTAAKNFRDAQDWVIDAGAIPKLVSTLAMDLTSDSDEGKAVLEAKKKALYALSALVRSNERGQRLFLLHRGPEVLGELLNGDVYPVNVQQKALLLSYDLMLESETEDVPTENVPFLKELYDTFRSSRWCKRSSAFFVQNARHLPQRQVIEVMDALRHQLPSCQAVFESAGVKSVVSTIAEAFAADEEFDLDEKEELALFIADLQGRLSP